MSELRIALIIVILGSAMIISTVLGVRHRSGVLMLALLSLLWLLVDNDFEGPVLLTVSGKHGLTASDLFGLGGLAVAAVLWLRVWASRKWKARDRSAAKPTPTSNVSTTGQLE